MIDQKIGARGRPRSFDVEAALATGQQLFHLRGYDAVGLAELTEALGIKPASFYAAFGSKARFFERVAERYAQSALALEDILAPDRPVHEALSELLLSAAQTYAEHPERRGCLVLEAARGNDTDESTIFARGIAEQRRSLLRQFIATSHPRTAAVVTDFMASTMSGLSASAREGMSKKRLVAVARAASMALGPLLEARD